MGAFSGTSLRVFTLVAAAMAGGCGQVPGAAITRTSAVASESSQLTVTRLLSRPRRAATDLLGVDAGGRLTVVVGDTRRHSLGPEFFSAHSWSPDGRFVVFGAAPRHDSGAGTRLHSDLYVADARGRQIRRLTRVGNAIDPVWSSAGGVIVFARAGSLRIYRHPPRIVVPKTLWAIRPDGSGLRRLEPDSILTTDTPSAFSPDGTTLLFTRGRPAVFGATAEIIPTSVYTLAMTSGAQRLLISDASQAVFSHDGTRLAFVSARDRSGSLNYGDTVHFATELYVSNADATAPTRLTFSRDIDEFKPIFSPDDQTILHEHGRVTGNAEAYSIWSSPAHGGLSQPLLFDRTDNTWYANPTYRHVGP